MVDLTNFSAKLERFDIPSFPKDFKDIKPVNSISKDEAKEFWDRFLGGLERESGMVEADIISDVYGRSEGDFSFDFNVKDSELQKRLFIFREEEWRALNEEERQEAVKSLESVIGQRLGIENLPQIEYYEADSYDCGAFIPNQNTICINKNNFDSPQEIVDTVAHELRHAFQYQRAQNIQTYEDFLYAYNFLNYISPETTEEGYVNFIDYQDQLIEAEARAFAKLFLIEEVRTYE